MFLICLESPSPRMLCLVEIGPVVLEKFRQGIFTILLLSPLGIVHDPSFEQTLPKDALCHFWLKLATWFWRGLYFKISSIYYPYSLLSPLEKGVALHLNQLRFPLLKDALC